MSQSCDESYDAYTETERKARKAHVCDACKEPIARGHRYFYITWVFDGSADCVKRCLGCQAIHLHLRKLGQGDDMWPSETLDCGEEYTDHWGKPPPEHIARLAFFSPEEKQALCFRVFRNHAGDHFIAHAVSELEPALGPWTEVPGDAGIPIVVDGAERFLYRNPDASYTLYQELHQQGLKELRQPHDFRSARAWAVEYGAGPLCSAEPVLPLQGPLCRTGLARWWAS